ncbi:glutaredoxin family protein [Nocardiopsis suaedae]|uniref:Glutaredoxin family protein n=1 Tax=Nocardiopsis suaedae TaxID=3018444 RepID=A0ABT4TQM9_9ACTN|nr:glutaredoxin family protein [Nocardiopsis suaedae]MDA2806994.1 glutaredoxin family protein [Nocardiopsis suaedae]
MLGRSGCHLCEEALEVIRRVAGELGVAYEVRDLDESPPAEREEYWERIPVTFVDGAPHDFWRVSEKRLRAALGAP